MSFRSYSLSIRSFRPASFQFNFRGGSFHPILVGRFVPLYFIYFLGNGKFFLASPIDFMQF